MMMLKATIIYPKDKEIDILTELGKIGIAEIIPIREEVFKGFRREVPEEVHRINIFIDSLEKLINDIKQIKDQYPSLSKIDIDELLASKSLAIEKRLYSLKELYDEFNLISKFYEKPDQLNLLEHELWALKILNRALSSDRSLEKYLISGKINLIRSSEDRAKFVEENLDALNIKYTTIRLEGKILFVLATDQEEMLQPLLELLTAYGIEILDVPLDKYKITSYDFLKAIIDDIEKKISKIRQEFISNFYENTLKLVALYRKAIITNKIMIAQTLTAKGDYTAILQCWVPEDEKDTLTSHLRRKVRNIIIEFDKPQKGEQPPRRIRVPKAFTPWASLLLQMGYPQKDDIFPWLIVGLLWAFMFGYMFPDIGQGLTLIVLGILFAKVKKIRNSVQGLLGFSGFKLGMLLLTAGVFSTIFGLLFGEFFLIEIYEPLIPNIKEHWIKDVSSIKWVIKYALVIGILEIIFAILLFMVRNLKHKHFAEIIFGEWGIPGLLMFFGLILTGLHFIGIHALLPPIRIGEYTIKFSFEKKGMATLNILNPADSWPLYLFFLGFVLILMGGKIEGNLGDKVPALIEVPLSIISNTLSFTRLAGFLIGHVAFSIMVEEFAMLGGSLGFWGGLIAMNLLVMTLEVLVVSLQSLRLLLYEFSTKWYIGGGRIFRPFKL